MQIPKQSQPIMRTVPAQPFALRGTAQGEVEGRATPSEHGVQPSIFKEIGSILHLLGGLAEKIPV
jgi:hypothetical protein